VFHLGRVTCVLTAFVIIFLIVLVASLRAILELLLLGDGLLRDNLGKTLEARGLEPCVSHQSATHDGKVIGRRRDGAGIQDGV